MRKHKLIIFSLILLITAIAWTFLGTWKVPFSTKTPSDYESISMLFTPDPEELTTAEKWHLLAVLNTIHIGIPCPDIDWKDMTGGRQISFILTEKDGTKTEIGVGNDCLILNGKGYKADSMQMQLLDDVYQLYLYNHYQNGEYAPGGVKNRDLND